MKKLIVSLMGVVSLAFSGLTLAEGSGAGIVGSPHDFTDNLKDSGTTAFTEIDGLGTAWNGREEICRVCHVPHDHDRATKYYLNGLLWNHKVSSQLYTMYDAAWSSTLGGTQSAQPDGTAKLCLGCHDGTVAVDTFDKYAGGAVFISTYNPDFQHPGAAIGADDLRGTHPLSIEYDLTAGANNNELNATTTAMGSSGTIADVLDNGKVQCSSCHDVHDQESVDGTHLLRVAQSVKDGGIASGLCLTCHIK